MKTYKRINEPLMKNGIEWFAIGDTSNEIIGDTTNWEETKTSVYTLKKGDSYWFIDSFGDICKSTWDNYDIDFVRRRFGNAHVTPEETKEALWRIEFEEKMRKEFKLNECDFKKPGEPKLYISYDHYNQRLAYGNTFLNEIQGVFYCNNEEIVKNFIEENKNDLLRYFGVNNER